MKIYLPTYQTIAEIPQDLKTQVENGKCCSWNRLSVYKVDADYCVVAFNLLERILHVVLQIFGKDYLGDKIKNELKKTNVVRLDNAALSATAGKTASVANPPPAPPPAANSTPAPTPPSEPEKEKSPIAPTLSEQEQKAWEKVVVALQGKQAGQVLKLYLPDVSIANREDLLDYQVRVGTFHSWAKNSNYLLIRSSEKDTMLAHQQPPFWRTTILISRELTGKQLMQSMGQQGLCKMPKEQEFLREVLLVKWPQQVSGKAVEINCRQSNNTLECVVEELLRQKTIHSWGWGRGREKIFVQFHEADQCSEIDGKITFRTWQVQFAEEKFKSENKIVIDEKLLLELPQAQQKDVRFVVSLLNGRTKHGVREISGDAYKVACEWLLKHLYIHAFNEAGKNPVTFSIFVKPADL